MGVRQGQETAAAPPLTVWKLSENIKPPGPRPRRSLVYGIHKAVGRGGAIYSTVIKVLLFFFFVPEI